MDYEPAHDEPHFTSRSGWLRAAVLGANDGIVSISALIVGVAAGGASREAIALAGLAGLIAGAMSMAAGEYVAVSSQSDIERSDALREARWLETNAAAEEAELASIYQARGLTPETAARVARELTEHDALGAHLRDELGLTGVAPANPVQAALTSAATFSVAGAVPLAAALLIPGAVIWPVVASTVGALVVLGVLGARAGGAPVGRAVLRAVFWGILALAMTAGVGKLFGIAV